MSGAAGSAASVGRSSGMFAMITNRLLRAEQVSLPNSRRCGKLQCELRSAAHFTVHADPPAVSFDDASGRRQAKAAAAALGAEKRVEHFHRGPLVHAAARVDEVEGNALPCDACADHKLTAVGHRFQSVLYEIH